mmetsp:Transcript_65190/g.169403  ORF Transcript_65190/g.169403 Transcript_65190/m.169403 type:complete len:260 (-) Transcript_65190:864-1643(-)
MVPWQVRHMHEDLRPLGKSQALLAELVQATEANPRFALMADNCQADALLEHLVGDCERDGSLHQRVRTNRFLDLERRDDLAAAVDDLLGTAADVEVAILVHPAEIACVEPAAGEEGLLCRLRIALVAAEERRPPDDDVADSPGRHRLALVVEDAQLRPDASARGAFPVKLVVQRGCGDRHALGHAVAWQHGAPVGCPHVKSERGQQPSSSIGNEPEVVLGEATPLELVQDHLVHDWACVVPSDGRLPLLHHVPELDGVE